MNWRTDAMRLARALRALHHFIHPGTSCPGPECQAAAAMAAHDDIVRSMGGAGRCRAGRAERKGSP